jgi:hypothetical protein
MSFRSRIFLITIAILVTVNSVSGQGINSLRKNINRPLREYRKTKNDKRRIERLTRSREKSVDRSEEASDTVFWSDFRYLPTNGTLGKHRKAFQILHGEQVKLFLNENKQYKAIYSDTLINSYYANTGRVNELSGKHDVIGWVPGYDSARVVNFNTNLLSIVSYNFIQFEPYTGELRKDMAYKNVLLGACEDLRKSSDNDLKVLLNVILPNPDDLHVFLNQDFAQSHFIGEVDKLLAVSKADGIEISFGRPLAKDSASLNRFIVRLSGRIKGGDSTRMTMLSLDPYLDKSAYNIPFLYPYIDRFVIMGFDFVDTYAQKPGPFAPLNTISNRHNINKSLFKYFINQNIVPDKVILGLPLVAPIWEGKLSRNNSNNQANLDLVDYLDYWDFKSTYEPRFGKPNYDYISGSSYYFDDADGRVKLVWLEDKNSLDVKFKWAKDNGLAGVGLYELSAAGSYHEISNLVADNFGKDSLVSISPIAFQNDNLYGFMNSLSGHRKHIGAGVIILLGCIFTGIFLCFFDWRIREIFFKNYDYRIVIATGIIVLCLIPVTIFLSMSSNRPASRDYDQFKQLMEENKYQVEEIKFEMATTLAPDSLREILETINGDEPLMDAEEYDQMKEDSKKRQRYQSLSKMKRFYDSLYVMMELQGSNIQDSAYRRTVNEQRKKLGDELLGLKEFEQEMSIRDQDLVADNRLHLALGDMVDTMNAKTELLENGQMPDRMVEFDQSDITISLRQGDQGLEDFYEVLCSALAGAFVMYLVTLIYIKRRQKLP